MVYIYGGDHIYIYTYMVIWEGFPIYTARIFIAIQEFLRYTMIYQDKSLVR